MIQKIE